MTAPEETTNPAQTVEQLGRTVSEGDWVKILDPRVASLFDQERAKVVILLKCTVDSNGKPIIEPRIDASPREKLEHDSQRLGGVREESRAVLFGIVADRSRKLEYEKSVPVVKLTKIETPPTEEQEVSYYKKLFETVPRKKADGNGSGNGNGNFAFRQNERKKIERDDDETPQRRRRRREK